MKKLCKPARKANKIVLYFEGGPVFPIDEIIDLLPDIQINFYKCEAD